MANYVYFITDFHGHIKIGIASNIRNRINVLQTGNPYKLRLLAALSVPCAEDALEIEKHLHNLFDSERLEGEWFKCDKVVDYLMQDEYYVPGYKFTGFAAIRKDDEEKGVSWVTKEPAWISG